MESQLQRLISENKVIPFVGAGVSKEIKYKDGSKVFPNWEELLRSFVIDIKEDSKKNVIDALLDDKPIDYLDIADRIEKCLTKNEFNRKIKESFDINFSEIDENTLLLAKTVWGLNSNLVITTNYDKVIYNSCNDINKKYWDIEAIHEQATSLRDEITKPIVWHIHGHIDNVNNIILTSKKYNELYTKNSQDSKYKSALETLRAVIQSKSLLFIGFSLDDEFIVEQLNRTIEIFGENSHEHYILCKKGSIVEDLNRNIKVIEYENHGEPLIEKLKVLSTLETNKGEDASILETKNLYHESAYNLTTLPAINDKFVGRKEELKQIEENLLNNSLTYIVNGIGGVGKSELSYQYLHENKHKYKNIAFIEITKETSSLEELFIRKFKETFSLDEKSNLDSVIQRLQGLPSRNLLLIDNLENRNDFDKIKVLNVNFDLLITTRIKDIDADNQLNLDTLNPDDAKKLFLSIYDKDTEIDDILIYLDNHPLFINLTAKSLSQEYVTLEELRENIKNNTISKIDSKDDKTFQEHLQNTYNKQFNSESNPELKKLLQILALYPSMEIEFEILNRSIGLEKLKVNLQKLVERGWLNKKENSYKLHQIIKTFVMSEYMVPYDDITFILTNIGSYIDTNDSTIIANKLNGYIPIIKSLLDIFSDKEDEYICGILDSLTYLFYSLAQYKKAMEVQTKSLEIRIKSFGKESKESAKSYNLISTIYKDMGELTKALEYQEKALKLIEEILGDKHPALASSYNNISTIYKDMGELTKALEYQEKALKLTEEILGYKHPALASIYNNISMIYQDMGELTKALEYQEKALKLTEEILGYKHPALASSYNNISTIYQDMGELTKALEYQEKALKLREEILGYKHPALASSYNNISMIYQDMGELTKALEYQEKALKLIEEILGDKHPNLALSYNNISTIYKDMGELTKALEYQEKALKLTEEILGYKHPALASSYNNISTIYQDMGELTKALEYQEKALKLREEILGYKHPDLASSYNNIAYIYKDKKECIKAKENFEKAILIWNFAEYYKKEIFNARKIIKEIDFNIKKEKKLKYNKKGKYCKDL